MLARPPIGGRAPLFFHGSRKAPVIALTIDDCYSNSAVLADLALFQQEHVNATFFPVGAVVAANPNVWRAVAAAGFPIGDHTMDHALQTGLSYAQSVYDIRRQGEVVKAITGQPGLPVLRPPGGDWDQMVLRAAAAAGQLAVVMWDVTLADTGRGPVEQLIINGERGTNGSILLMHANDSRTQQALPAIIAYYRERGFSFATVGQLLGVPGAVPHPAVAPSPTPSPEPLRQ